MVGLTSKIKYSTLPETLQTIIIRTANTDWTDATFSIFFTKLVSIHSHLVPKVDSSKWFILYIHNFHFFINSVSADWELLCFDSFFSRIFKLKGSLKMKGRKYKCALERCEWRFSIIMHSIKLTFPTLNIRIQNWHAWMNVEI